jgi:hypothetical protein
LGKSRFGQVTLWASHALGKSRFGQVTLWASHALGDIQLTIEGKDYALSPSGTPKSILK